MERQTHRRAVEATYSTKSVSSYAVKYQDFGPETGTVPPESLVHIMLLIEVVCLLAFKSQDQGVGIAAVNNRAICRGWHSDEAVLNALD